MSTPEELASRIDDLKDRIGDLQEDVRLSDLRDELEDLQTTVNSLDQRIARLRARGYVFEKELEGQAADLAAQWEALASSVIDELDLQSHNLQEALRPLARQALNLSSTAPEHTVSRLEDAVEALEDEVEAVEDSLRGMYDTFESQVNALSSHLDQVDWTLKQVAEGSFSLLATEAIIMAVKAVWARSGDKERKGDPEGVLYLTDQRLIFEQKEKVTTRKVLFIPTEKKLVQNTLLEAPVALVEEVKPYRKGFLGKDDYIEIAFASGAPVARATFHIWQPGETWQGLIQRARAKDFDRTRVAPVPEEAVEKVRAAPTECPACGATINQVILRGQDSITCEYCGYVIRL